MWKRPLVVSCTAALASHVITTPVLAENRQQEDTGSNLRRPGLYAWGSNTHQVINDDKETISVKIPTRIPYFDGRLLKDVAINEYSGVAVLENGDVIQWHDGQKMIVKGKNISSVKLSGQTVIAFSYKNGKIYEWSTSDAQPEPELISLPKLWWFESLKNIQVGQNHILALTSRGRIFSGSINSPEKSKAQFGIASHSQFDAPPASGSLHVIKLLEDIPMKQIAVGENHSLALSRDGRLYVFGENTNGQSGIPFSYKTANIGAPTELWPGRRFSNNSRVSEIAAGGNITYFTTIDSTGRSIYSLGNGITGQLGTGSYSHSQVDPLRIKRLEDLQEYSEKAKSTIPMEIENWSVGTDHTFVTVKSSSEGSIGKNVFAWGWNDRGQLGTGKRATLSHPTQLRNPENNMPIQLMEKEKLKYMDDSGKLRNSTISQEIVAGNKCSAIYYKPV